MDSRQIQTEIEKTIEQLREQFQRVKENSAGHTGEEWQNFLSGIRKLYSDALELQHQQAILSMEELEALIAARHAATPARAQAQPVESLLPKSAIQQANAEEPLNSTTVEAKISEEQIKPVLTHPSMDDLLVAAANKAAEARQVQDTARRKKVITDIHDKFDEVPTLAGKFNDTETVAKRMAGSHLQTAVADKLRRKPIQDLKVAIGANEKFLFINQLFSGDSQAYNGSIELLNSCGNLDAAKNHIEQNLKNKYDWDTSSHPASLFIDLIERRYIS